MKEIIKKIVICVIAAAVVIGIAVSVLNGDKPDAQQTTASAADSTQEANDPSAPADSQGNVSANATTGKNGDVQQNSSGSAEAQSTTGSQNAATSQNADVQPSSQGGTQASQPAQPQSSQPSQPSQQGNVQQNTGTQINTQPAQPQQPANKIDVYQQIFASGKFIMKVNDPDLGPVTMAMNGNKMFIDASMEGITLKMLYDGDKPDETNPNTGTWYIVVDKIKKYSPMPADMLGDMNVEDLTKDIAKGDGNTVYTKSTETVNGETLEVESCVDSNGNTTKYYFRGDQLVRSDSVSPSGEISTTEFQEISANVDDSLFEIPVGYAKLDISWLFSMMG